MEEKKVYDIFPPDQGSEEKEPLAVEEDRGAFKEPADIGETEPAKKSKIQRRPPLNPPKEKAVEALFFGKKPEPHPKPVFKMGKLGWLLVFIAFILLIGAVVFFVYLPKVTIDIWLKTENQIAQEKIEAIKNLKELDLAGRQMAGTIVTEEKFVSQDFPSSGKITKETKAQGIIRIFNDYSTSSQSLLASTRFISNGGKLFRLVEKTVVPGQTVQGGKTSPGFVDAKVVADAVGSEYNIGPSTFSIPGFVGTPKYTAFYAQSFSQISGGFKGETAVVTEQDLKVAKDTLKTKIDEVINSALEEKTLPDFILVKDGSPLEIVEESSLAKAGEAVSNFTYQVKARKSGLLLLKNDLEKFGETYSSSQIPEGKKILLESLKVTPVIEAINSQTGKATLNVEISAKTYEPLDKAGLKAQLAEKPLQEVALSLQGMSQISRAKIKIFPSFFNDLPKEINKIEINIKFE
jgi:hypothetical protein